MPIVHPQDFKCDMCGIVSPDCGFYERKGLVRGHLASCKKCHCKKTVDRRRAVRNAGMLSGELKDLRKHKPRMSEEERLRRDREKVKRYYQKNLEECRRKNREYARKRIDCADFKYAKNMAKRGGSSGLTVEQFNSMFEAQGSRCAICRSADPGTKIGWNLDHCHKSLAVRFILCAHCNRGLGAFRDSPELMRRAADMLENQRFTPVPVAAVEQPAAYDGKYQGQADEPVAAIMEPGT